MSRRPPAVIAPMLLLAGMFFLACAVLYNTWIVSAAVRQVNDWLSGPETAHPPAASVHDIQLAYLAIALAFLLASVLVRRVRSLSRLAEQPTLQKITLAVLTLLIPLATLEIAARPFAGRVGKHTTLFIRDDALGWRMRPGAVAPWGGLTVRVNADGLRGPRVPIERRDGARRILYLGDSVTFGYRIARHTDTYPFVADSLLAARTGVEVETVNAGVGGYSPWQELIYLQETGIEYAPDLVVVGFVLNDVTEKFTLDRFGGEDTAFQLRESYYSWWDHIVSRSALGMGIRRFAIEFHARRRLGDDVQLGAVRRQRLDVETLIHHPDQKNVETAWRITLQNVRDLFEFCRERDTPALLVVFPYAMQLAAPDEMSAPQQTLMTYARQHDIAAIDLLPFLADHLSEADATEEYLFMDADHLTINGHRLVGEILAERMEEILE